MRRIGYFFLCSLVVLFAFAQAARADDADSGPAPYAKWVAGATSQSGLFTLWRKSGKVYVEMSSSQLGKEFVQSAAPANGLGGWAIVWGEAMFAQTRIITFTRSDNKIVMTWPNTFFKAPEGSSRERSVQQSFSPSIVALAPIVAEDTATGKVVFDASPFLGDVLNLTAVLKASIGTGDDPEETYKLDPDRTYFGPTKAFPENVIIEADQTFEGDNPTKVDTVPDPRSIQLRVVYNIAQPPDDKDYMPRIYDHRVGYVASPYLKFGNDLKVDQNINYIVRWNMQPTDPTKPISPAKHPMVFWLSNTIPDEYRPTIRESLLEWNQAFEKIGISDAVQVKDQPADASWDPDDIRYNVVRWVTEAYPSFGAEAQWVYDPRTGQLFHTGILIDAVEGYGPPGSWDYFVNPVRSLGNRGLQQPMSYAMGKMAETAYGMVALNLMGRMSATTEQQYTLEAIRSTVLHESGHDMGFQHNFIAGDSYSAKDLQNKGFTSRMGVATSVMHYAPVNIWPKGTGQGNYWQVAVGPYDYYAIKWGYARIPGARTPEDELPDPAPLGVCVVQPQLPVRERRRRGVGQRPCRRPARAVVRPHQRRVGLVLHAARHDAIAHACGGSALADVRPHIPTRARCVRMAVRPFTTLRRDRATLHRGRVPLASQQGRSGSRAAAAAGLAQGRAARLRDAEPLSALGKRLALPAIVAQQPGLHGRSAGLGWPVGV